MRGIEQVVYFYKTISQQKISKDTINSHWVALQWEKKISFSTLPKDEPANGHCCSKEREGEAKKRHASTMGETVSFFCPNERERTKAFLYFVASQSFLLDREEREREAERTSSCLVDMHFPLARETGTINMCKTNDIDSVSNSDWESRAELFDEIVQNVGYFYEQYWSVIIISWPMSLTFCLSIGKLVFDVSTGCTSAAAIRCRCTTDYGGRSTTAAAR